VYLFSPIIFIWGFQIQDLITWFPPVKGIGSAAHGFGLVPEVPRLPDESSAIAAKRWLAGLVFLPGYCIPFPKVDP